MTDNTGAPITDVRVSLSSEVILMEPGYCGEVTLTVQWKITPFKRNWQVFQDVTLRLTEYESCDLATPKVGKRDQAESWHVGLTYGDAGDRWYLPEKCCKGSMTILGKSWLNADDRGELATLNPKEKIEVGDAHFSCPLGASYFQSVAAGTKHRRRFKTSWDCCESRSRTVIEEYKTW